MDQIRRYWSKYVSVVSGQTELELQTYRQLMMVMMMIILMMMMIIVMMMIMMVLIFDRQAVPRRYTMHPSIQTTPP